MKYDTNNVMTCSGVGHLRSFFKKLGMEMHLVGAENVTVGPMKVGDRRVYTIWCNTTAKRRRRAAKCIVVRRGRSQYAFRIRE